MDTKLTQIVKKVITDYAEFYSQGNEFPLQPLFDDQRQRYLLLEVGWYGDEYVHYTPIHIDLIDDKVWIQCDETEEGVAIDLLKAGIAKNNIILGFRHPKVRPFTEFAAN